MEMRLEEIQKLKRQIKLTSIVAATSIVLSVAIGTATMERKYFDTGWPDEHLGSVQAKEIYVVNSEGSPRIRIGYIKSGPAITIFNGSGDPKVMLTMSDEGQGLAVINSADGAHSMTIGSSEIELADGTTNVVRVAGTGAGGPAISLHDQDGFNLQLGRAVITDRMDGSKKITSAASIAASSKDTTVQWTPWSSASTAKK
jgi:hypothetical protein